MRLRVMLAVVAIGSSLLTSVPAQSMAQQVIDCSPFDSWQWAQSLFDTNPDGYRQTMDPDGNNIACEHLPIRSFAPDLWGDPIPVGAEPAQVVSVTDGDTIDVLINGTPTTVRLYHINAPERSTSGGGPHCGAESAKAHLAFILSFAPGDTVYLEYDITEMDPFGRRLAYVWFDYAGSTYMVNEAMVRNGYAESETYEPDVKYREQLNTAEQFSIEKVLGVRLECGRFGQPLDSQPSREQLAQAWRSQPNQGQFPDVAPLTPAPPNPTPTPPMAWPTPTAAPNPPDPGPCDPSYPDVCIPPIGQTGDLDCWDVPYDRFKVLQPDPHYFRRGLRWRGLRERVAPDVRPRYDAAHPVEVECFLHDSDTAPHSGPSSSAQVGRAVLGAGRAGG